MDSSSANADIDRQIRRRRAAVAAEWQDHEGIVLIGAGELIPRPGRDDSSYRFEPHSEYFYLTDRTVPGAVMAFDPGEGWTHFAKPVTASDRLWSGAPPGDVEGPTTDQLPAWLRSRSSLKVAWLGSAPADARLDTAIAEELRFGLSVVRRPKDAVELARMRFAQKATQAAFAVVLPLLKDGVSERQLQIELEAEVLRRDCEAMGYTTTLGGGPNSGVLHFRPTARPLRSGELVLIDAGAQFRGYTSDITRTYPVGGAFSPIQQDVHRIVHHAEQAAIALCAPGVECSAIHLQAALTITEGLVALELLRGDPEELVASGATWLFFPHGIGHLVGLGVRDAGNTPLRERRDKPKPFPTMRVDLPLEPGMVMTIEPGVYFVPAILTDPENRAQHHDSINWHKVDQLLDFGGVRIEDNVLITANGHEVISAELPLLGQAAAEETRCNDGRQTRE